MAIRGRKHTHRYLPSKCCSWECKCGSTWAACLGGHESDRPCTCEMCPSALKLKALAQGRPKRRAV